MLDSATMRCLSLLLTALLLTACGDDAASPDAAVHDAEVPDAEGVDANREMPATLEESGLYSDFAGEVLADGVHAYSPEYWLWSDGATKRRWIYLPPDTTIDTSDMDYWVFPEGAKLWKEFTRDGVRVETRMIQKIGPEPHEWFYAAYAWNEARTEAIASPLGVDDALGTDHDIPSRSDCRKCHDRLSSRVLGFQAIDLDHPPIEGEINLGDAISMGWLSVAPAGTGNGDSFPLPGNAVDQEALGYLHTNCGNCHNPSSDVQNQAVVDWRLRVATLGSVAETPSFTTAVNVPNQLTVAGATAIIEPQNLEASAAYLRFTSTSEAIQMPPIGHELVDETGRLALAAWINSLTP